MTTLEIQRQYDEIIAPHYDLDPQSVTRRALTRALGQLQRAESHPQSISCLSASLSPMDVLDVGIGTGLFLELLRRESGRPIRPYGLDLSPQMIEVAKTRLPDLTAAVDDAANMSRHFTQRPFDLICTHFVTGFVPLDLLAPAILSKLKPGALWSFVGGTSQGFPQLRQVANSRIISLLFGGRALDLSDLKTPVDEAEVVRTLRRHSFEICDVETYEPELLFGNFEEFMDFAWRGGWLTPFIEDLGIQHAGKPLRVLLDRLVFPVSDCHRIVVALARKPRESGTTGQADS